MENGVIIVYWITLQRRKSQKLVGFVDPREKSVHIKKRMNVNAGIRNYSFEYRKVN